MKSHERNTEARLPYLWSTCHFMRQADVLTYFAPLRAFATCRWPIYETIPVVSSHEAKTTRAGVLYSEVSKSLFWQAWNAAAFLRQDADKPRFCFATDGIPIFWCPRSQKLVYNMNPWELVVNTSIHNSESIQISQGERLKRNEEQSLCSENQRCFQNIKSQWPRYIWTFVRLFRRSSREDLHPPTALEERKQINGSPCVFCPRWLSAHPAVVAITSVGTYLATGVIEVFVDVNIIRVNHVTSNSLGVYLSPDFQWKLEKRTLHLFLGPCGRHCILFWTDRYLFVNFIQEAWFFSPDRQMSLQSRFKYTWCLSFRLPFFLLPLLPRWIPVYDLHNSTRRETETSYDADTWQTAECEDDSTHFRSHGLLTRTMSHSVEPFWHWTWNQGRTLVRKWMGP